LVFERIVYKFKKIKKALYRPSSTREGSRTVSSTFPFSNLFYLFLAVIQLRTIPPVIAPEPSRRPLLINHPPKIIIR
jgi:hypothetical protein